MVGENVYNFSIYLDNNRKLTPFRFFITTTNQTVEKDPGEIVFLKKQRVKRKRDEWDLA